jgi:hypothetical protein
MKIKEARVVKLADAQGLEPCGRNSVGVQVPPRAPVVDLTMSKPIFVGVQKLKGWTVEAPEKLRHIMSEEVYKRAYWSCEDGCEMCEEEWEVVKKRDDRNIVR